MIREPDDRPIDVLIPGGEAVRPFADHPNLRGILYDAEREPTREQQRATVIVVGLSDVEHEIAFMRALPQLKLVQTLSAGFDQWVVRLPAGVGLSNARGAHGRATAEWVAAVLLAHYRDLGAFAVSQAQKTWNNRITGSLEGKLVAVLGAGDIGTNIHRMLAPFGCQISLVGRSRRDGVITMDDFRSIRSQYDVIALAVPVAPETREFVDAKFLASMKDGAVLVNLGRGALVVTDALLAETQAGRLRAILDVTDPEPLPPSHPLWTSPGVTITPHVAGATAGVLERAWKVAAHQIDMYARGETPTNLIADPSR